MLCSTTPVEKGLVVLEEETRALSVPSPFLGKADNDLKEK